MIARAMPLHKQLQQSSAPIISQAARDSLRASIARNQNIMKKIRPIYRRWL
jgi:hypothetical protein